MVKYGMDLNLTTIVLTKNEESIIERCLKSIAWCSEIIIVDDFSQDQTLEIAKKYGAKIFTRSLNGDFAAQRNFGLSKGTNDYVFFVDADEVVTLELQFEIQQLLLSGNAKDRYLVKRIDFMWEKKILHGEAGNTSLVRLAKRQSGKWQGRVHEKWVVKGKIGELRNPIFHYPHQSLSEFLSEINRYSTIRAEELFEQKKQIHWWSIILYPKGKFFVNYIVKTGFLDGMRGLIFVLLMSFHSFLVRGKLWLLWKKKV